MEYRYREGYCSGYAQAASDVEAFIEGGLDIDTIRRALQEHEAGRLARWAEGNCGVIDSPPVVRGRWKDG